METVIQQVTPILEQVTQTTGLDLTAISAALSGSQSQSTSSAPPFPDSAVSNVLQSILPRVRESSVLTNGGDSRSTSGSGESDEPTVKIEDDVSDAFGQLALDEHGHLHWIGKSSTMTLIQQLRDATTAPVNRISPMEEDPTAPGPSANKLYYPASVFFGKVRALPPPEEVEYPERDLADKLVSSAAPAFSLRSAHESRPCVANCRNLIGRCVLRAVPLPDARHRQAIVPAQVQGCDGPPGESRVQAELHGIHSAHVLRLRCGVALRGRPAAEQEWELGRWRNGRSLHRTVRPRSIRGIWTDMLTFNT